MFLGTSTFTGAFTHNNDNCRLTAMLRDVINQTNRELSNEASTVCGEVLHIMKILILLMYESLALSLCNLHDSVLLAQASRSTPAMQNSLVYGLSLSLGPEIIDIIPLLHSKTRSLSQVLDNCETSALSISPSISPFAMRALIQLNTAHRVSKVVLPLT